MAMITLKIKMTIKGFAERSGNSKMTYTQIKALIVLLKGIEDAGLWKKIDEIYPFIGNSRFKHPIKFNF
jgi:hypothetical protein